MVKGGGEVIHFQDSSIKESLMDREGRAYFKLNGEF